LAEILVTENILKKFEKNTDLLILRFWKIDNTMKAGQSITLCLNKLFKKPKN